MPKLPGDDVRIHQEDRSHPCQSLRELSGDRRGQAIGAGLAGRDHGYRAGSGRGHPGSLHGQQAIHGQQPVHEQPHDPRHQLGTPLEQRPERRHPQHQQVAVPHRAHGGCPRPVGEQRHLPDDRAAAKVVEHAVSTVGGHGNPEPAADHQEQAVAGVALLADHLAGADVHRIQLSGDLMPGGLVKRPEQGDVGEERAQFGHGHQEAGAY